MYFFWFTDDYRQCTNIYFYPVISLGKSGRYLKECEIPAEYSSIWFGYAHKISDDTE